MNGRKLLIGVVIVIASVIGWAAFRPERLFVNAKVNETFPAAASAATNSDAQLLVSGVFPTRAKAPPEFTSSRMASALCG